MSPQQVNVDSQQNGKSRKYVGDVGPCQCTVSSETVINRARIRKCQMYRGLLKRQPFCDVVVTKDMKYRKSEKMKHNVPSRRLKTLIQRCRIRFQKTTILNLEVLEVGIVNSVVQQQYLIFIRKTFCFEYFTLLQ